MYVLSDGDDAHIVSDRWSMNSLILSYGNNAHIASVSSARIEVYGKGTKVHLTGTNHAIKFSEGTELHYDQKVLIAGVDFKADTYYVTEKGKLVLMRRRAPEVEKDVTM